MGYPVDKNDCKGRIDATCPYNSSKVKCTTCTQLGYDKTAKECEGLLSTKCPYDSSQMSCISPNDLTCEKLGYAMKESQCYSGVIRCPYDTSKVSCTDAYVGEIRAFAGSSIPKGWKLLNSDTQISSITYKNLYSVIGFTFGGNSTSFQLPNLLSRFIIGANTSYYLGNKGGTTTETLTVDQMPSHKHLGTWGENTKESETPPYGTDYKNNHPGSNENDRDNEWFYTSPAGGNAAHNNMPPYTTIRYIMFTGKY